MLRILIDPQVFWWQKFGGISRYHCELIKYLQSESDVELTIPLISHNNAHLNEMQLLRISPFYRFLNGLNFKGSFTLRIRLIPYKSHSVKAIKKQDYDLLVPTFFDPYFLDYIGDIPYVLTVHDMTHELYPDSFPKDKEFVANKARLVRNAKRIIAISEATKRDVLKYYPEVEGRVDLVYHGHSVVSESGSYSGDLPEKYLLFVGKRWMYKNFEFMLKHVAEHLIEYDDLHLICAGGGAFTAEETQMISELGLSHKIKYIDINDSILAYLYQHALCFIFPSLNEGFGFPVLEAMSCDCLTVLPRASSFPEVAGDAGLFYEDGADFVRIIHALVKGEIDTDAYIKAGIEQARKFDWAKCVKQTKEVYLRALDSEV